MSRELRRKISKDHDIDMRSLGAALVGRAGPRNSKYAEFPVVVVIRNDVPAADAATILREAAATVEKWEL